MIVLPAIGAIVAAVTPIVEAALIAAGIGAVVGGAACGIGGVASGIHEHGALNQEIAEKSAHRAAECAVEGALIGGATGAIGIVVAPVVSPAITVVDDVARPVIQVLDDASKPVVSAVDDVLRPTVHSVDEAVHTAGENAGSAVTRRGGRSALGPVTSSNYLRNVGNAQNFRSLPKGVGNKGYVYVMNDIATPGRYKIGKTTRPVDRLVEVQSKTGLKLDYTCIIGTDNMDSLEGSVFEEFKPQRRKNLVPGSTEIFLLNAVQVASACSK